MPTAASLLSPLLLGLALASLTGCTRERADDTDCDDADADGVCHLDDLCSGDDATGDADLDGICDDLDVCTGDDTSGDADADGVCDDTDVCTGDDTSGDADADGVCDDTDVCTGSDATGDADADGVCDDTDVCTGSDATGDADADGVCDDTDPCPADAADDSDGDGSCESDDLCIGSDTAGDTDADGVCDDTDPCPDDASDDSDADGSCDSDDLCVGNDTTGDTDADGVCDDIDVCPLDDPNDTDGDGVCDADDVCSRGDDTLDDDGDGIPNECEKVIVAIPPGWGTSTNPDLLWTTLATDPSPWCGECKFEFVDVPSGFTLDDLINTNAAVIWVSNPSGIAENYTAGESAAIISFAEEGHGGVGLSYIVYGTNRPLASLVGIDPSEVLDNSVSGAGTLSVQAAGHPLLTGLSDPLTGFSYPRVQAFSSPVASLISGNTVVVADNGPYGGVFAREATASRRLWHTGYLEYQATDDQHQLMVNSLLWLAGDLN